MKLKKQIIVTAICLAAAVPSQAATVFSDTFDYTTANAFIAEGGWTTLVPGGTLGGNFGSNASGGGAMWGNPTSGGNTTAAIEYNHTVALSEGDVINMDANVLRTGGYSYGMRIILWDGTDAGTRLEVAGGTEAASSTALTQVNYTVTAADILAGRDEVIFQYGHDGNWGETADVTFGVTAVPEPSSAALLGLGGLALIMRRRK